MGKLFFKGLNTSNTGDWQVTLEVIFLAKPFKNENDKHSFGFFDQDSRDAQIFQVYSKISGEKIAVELCSTK